MDAVRYAGVPRPGDHPFEGLQQVGGLVELRRPSVRDERGLLSVLRGQPHEDLREDSRWKVPVPRLLLRGPQGPRQEPPAGRPDQALRQPQKRRQRHQESQVLQEDRLA